MITKEQIDFLEGEFLKTKQKQLWATEMELAFALEYHEEDLKPGALTAARTAIAKLREKKDPDHEKILELSGRIEDIKNSVKTVDKWTQLCKDLNAQIEWITQKLEEKKKEVQGEES